MNLYAVASLRWRVAARVLRSRAAMAHVVANQQNPAAQSALGSPVGFLEDEAVHGSLRSLLPHALPDPDALLARVLSAITWEDRMRARRTASYGRPYDYSGQRYAEAPMPAVIAEIRDVAARHAGHPFDNCLCNLYATGASTMGFHHDSYDELVADSLIAIVSLGAVRTLRFRSRDKAHERSFALEAGSLLFMDAETQRAWLHAVKGEPGAGLRVSLTFRRLA